MQMRLGQLRRLVREVLLREYPAGAGCVSPVDPDGAYPWDNDLFAHGLLTPGQSIDDYNSFRPADAKLDLGMKRDASTNANAVHPVSLGQVGVAARGGTNNEPAGTDDLSVDPDALVEEPPEI